MKRHRMRGAFDVFLISWALAGCGDPTGPADDFVLTAQVNGRAWQAGGPGGPPHAFFYEGDSTISVGGGRLGSGYSDGIAVSIRRVTGPGTYPLGDPATSSAGLYSRLQGTLGDGTSTWTWYWTSAVRRGTVVLTAFEPSTNTLQGTFTFEAETALGAWVTVTGGSFSGHYQTSNGKGS